MTKFERFFSTGVLLASSVACGQTTATVFVPGNTLGDFGSPSVQGNQPYVTGIVATGPGTIVVTYLSGEVTDCCPNFSTGPNGTPFDFGTAQSPLQETAGIAGGTVGDTDALIGTFVPKLRTLATGFKAVDGTKDLASVGLLPSALFFIGAAKTFSVLEAGTLFLGINDSNAADNSGGYNVSITFTPAP